MQSSKEEKDAKKDAKKKAKDDKKEAKLAEKSARKGSASAAPSYPSSVNGSSSSTWASGSMLRSNSNLDAILDEDQGLGKGKAPAQDFAGFIPLTEPTSTLNTEMAGSKDISLSAADDAQKYLEESRANLHPAASMPIPSPSRLLPHTRQFSDASSIASSFDGSSPAGSIRNDSNFSPAMASGLDVPSPTAGGAVNAPSPAAPGAASGLEPMLNFRSLAAMVGDEDKTNEQGNDHIENTETAESEPQSLASATQDTRGRGDSDGCSGDSPPVYDVDDDQITPAAGPRDMGVVHGVDSKEIVDGEFFSRVHSTEATQ